MRGPRTAMKSGPHLPQLEKALAQKWRPKNSQKKKKKTKNKTKQNITSIYIELAKNYCQLPACLNVLVNILN